MEGTNKKSGGDFAFSNLLPSFLVSSGTSSPGDNNQQLTEIVTHPNPELTKFEKLLKQTEYIIFNKPDAEVFSSSLLYEIIFEDENHRIIETLHVIKRTASRFQPRCDIVLMTKEGETLLQLVNPKRLIHKIKVCTGEKVLGSIIKSRLNIFGPKYRLRDADKKELATITSSRKYCCLTCQKLCCGANFGVFQVIRKVRHQINKVIMSKENAAEVAIVGNNNVTPHPPPTCSNTSVASIASNGDQLLGVICRDVTFNERAGHAAIMEITFENSDVLDVRMKSLIIAAAIFIDFSVFVPQAGQADVKMIIATGIVLAIIFGLAWVGISFM